ncbi:hypothetical protein [Polaromonas sp. OV174]|uniref:hypothetical protein n=1 Tax=Polaromonas sp. OV174 TaxID=1855300 RepID=UPI001160CDD2|nr:hypothetical protein [Polaromonas sp. OV174]
MAIDFEHRVRCQQSGCGHSVHAAVHIVKESSLVVGSTCFAKRHGSAGTLGAVQHGGDLGRKLTNKERILLAENSQMLLAHFEEQETVSMANTVQAIKLSSYQAIKLSSYQAIKLSSYQAIKLSSYQAIKLFQSCGFRGPKVGR